METKLRRQTPEALKSWFETEKLRFIRDCELLEQRRWIPEDLRIESTKLSTFCQKWMEVSAFKVKNEDTEWRPITPEQNSLRVTMIQELLAISETDLQIPNCG